MPLSNTKTRIDTGINLDLARLAGKEPVGYERTKKLNKRLDKILARRGITDKDAYLKSITTVTLDSPAPDVYISGNVFAMLGLISHKKS